MNTFPAYRIFDEGGKSIGRIIQLTLNDLDEGDVLIRTHFAGVNYKDALAATGAGKVIRRFPCVGGVDVSGIVESSLDARFKVGDQVLVTGYDMGVSHDGGFAQYVRVSADWVVPLPVGMSLFDAMTLGTAGFTAALAIERLEQNELTPSKGKVLVTGATGGVGSLAIKMLSQLGYSVVALTSKRDEQAYLRSLGASEVLLRSEVDFSSSKPLEKSQWAGAIDAVGGDTLAWIVRTMQIDGAIASVGNAGGAGLNTSVFPFILRGVRLLGIDSVGVPMPLRKKLWQRLSSDLRIVDAELVAHRISLQELPQACASLVAGTSHGRFVVDFSNT
ncbi:MAG: oxidoreductase [Sideroxydans sp.]|nr:oxidoreductase [Sideroxydans sp.]